MIRWFGLFLFFWYAHANASGSNTEEFTRDSVALGQSIFELGIGRDGRAIGATLHGLPLSGAAIACSGCHGQDARGGGEAFIVAPDIRWSRLNNPFPSRRAAGAGKSYDIFSFTKAIRSGYSADGRQLDPAMPRFDLADDEINSLIAYLSAIDQQTTSLEKRFNIISLLPISGHSKYADELSLKLNDCASLHVGVPIAAIDTLYFSTPEDALKQLENYIERSANPLVLLPFIMGWEDKYTEFIRSNNIPTALPFSFLDPPLLKDGVFEKQWHFYFPGLQSQLKALMRSIHREDYTHIRIIHNLADELSVRLNEIVLHEAERLNMAVLTHVQKNDQQDFKIAAIWLTPTAMNQSFERFELNPDIQMLVPVFFFTQDADPSFSWRVAYPYKPRDDDGQWLSPVDVWTSAACTFLVNLSSSDLAKNDGAPLYLEWGDGFKLNGRLDPESLSDTVFIHDYE